MGIVAVCVPSIALAGAFETYALTSTFALPENAHGLTVLADGRLLTVAGTDVYVETAVGSRAYMRYGELSGADFSGFGPGFLRVSPDGNTLAVGNSGGASFSNYQVGVFDVGTLSGRWFDANHFDAAWVGNSELALTGGTVGAPGFVSVFDTSSANAQHPSNPIVVANVGGASGGVALDAAGNLYTGNGYAIAGPSATGAVKAFDASSWRAPLDGGAPVDFELEGTLVVEALSAAPLRFDGDGNLLVGGGDFDGGEFGFAALVKGSALSGAMAGLGAVDTSDPEVLRRFDPDPLDDFNYYSVDFNEVTGELYVRDGIAVYAYTVPEPAALLLLSVGALALLGRRTAGSKSLCSNVQTPRAAGFSPRETSGTTVLKDDGRSFGSRERFGHEDDGGAGARSIGTFVLVCCVLVRVGHAETSDLKSQTNSFPINAAQWDPGNNSFQTGSPFAVDWIEYEPAPGYWVRDPQFNNPDRARGRPIGGGTEDANLDSLVSLGGFGGSITLAFDHTVADDPLNPYGLDAIVFGNAIWQLDDSFVADPNRHWAECGTIEIALDVNGDGLANDPWYLIPGSHITDPPGRFFSQTWDNNIADPTYPPADLSWIPIGRSGEWQTDGFLLPAEVFGQTVVVNPAADEDREGIYGYADYTPTLLLGDLDADNLVDDPSLMPEAFYTVPDDPFTIGISAGSGGGDAFDIAWAVDASTGLPASLSGFDFIRITTAVNIVHAVFGEYSPEIDAVADVAPDPFGDYDEDGDIDLADAAGFWACFRSGDAEGLTCARMDREPDGKIDLIDFVAFAKRITGPLS